MRLSCLVHFHPRTSYSSPQTSMATSSTPTSRNSRAPFPLMELPVEIRFKIYSLCLGGLTLFKAGQRPYTRRSCTKCEDNSMTKFRCIWSAQCSCQDEKLQFNKMFSVNQEARSFYLERSEFRFYDLVAFEAFAKIELYRELVTRIILFYMIEASTRASATASARAAKTLLEFKKLRVLQLHIDSSTVFSKCSTGKLKVHGERDLRKLRNIEISVTYEGLLCHDHPEVMYTHLVDDAERRRFCQELQLSGTKERKPTGPEPRTSVHKAKAHRARNPIRQVQRRR